MFSINLWYLNGWSMAASDGSAKEQAEWPPHPDRVFMAMAAAWFETGEDRGEEGALRWLESLSPPGIAASGHTVRNYTSSYVPVNDIAVSKKPPSSSDLSKLKGRGLQLLPAYRTRQERRFPVAIPYDAIVRLIWKDADPGIHRRGLEAIASNVTHVGHSASFVRAWITYGDGPDPRIVPTDGLARHNLRMFFRGRLDMLIRDYNSDLVNEYSDLNEQLRNAKRMRGKKATAEQRRLNGIIKERFGGSIPKVTRPTPMRWQRYDTPAEQPPTKTDELLFDKNLIILAVKGKITTLPATLRVTHALRGALMASCPKQPPPEWFSGHDPRGAATTNPHMAIIPLPFVGNQHADGRIMGAAIVPPAGLESEEIEACLGTFLYDAATRLPREHKLFDGQWFECPLVLETREDPPKNLRASTWTQPSRRWASVTPVVLDRHFGGRNKWELAANSVKDACQRIGLPRPTDVLLNPISLVEGAPPTREYPALTRKSDGGSIAQSHAVLSFEERVSGPVIIGTGRFRGYGLCRPLGV